jgi:hypothetical protein
MPQQQMQQQMQPQQQQYGSLPVQGAGQGSQTSATAPLGGVQLSMPTAVPPGAGGVESAAFPQRSLPEQQRAGMPPPPELFRSQSQGLQGNATGAAPSMQTAQSQIHQASMAQHGPSTVPGSSAPLHADGVDVRMPGNAMPPGQYKPPMQQIPQGGGYASGPMADSTNGGLSTAAANVPTMSTGSYQFQPGTRPAGLSAVQPQSQYSGQYHHQVQQHQQQYSQGQMQAQQYHPPPQQQAQQMQQAQQQQQHQQPQQFVGQYGQQHAQQMQSQTLVQQPQQHQTHQYTQQAQLQQSMPYAPSQQQQPGSQYTSQHTPQQQHALGQPYNPTQQQQQQQQLSQHQQQGLQYSHVQQRPQLQSQMGMHSQQQQPLQASQQPFLHQQHQQYQPQYQAQQQAPQQQQQQPQWVTSSGMTGLTAPPVVGQVVPQALMAKGAAKLPRVRVKTPKPGKKALAAAVAAGNFIHSGHEYNTMMDSTAGPDGPPGGGGGNLKPMTYKEKRAASSKKAIAAAAEAERVRNGDVNAREDGKRKEAKRERDVAVHADADGRPDKDKSEKEESSTALLKRRDPVAARLEEIENAKFLGRKCPPAMLPAIVPILPDGNQAKAAATASSSWANHVIAPIPVDRRRKTHWDYLLEEVQWMAVDFRQELRWKLAASKVMADACVTSSSRCRIASVGRISADDAAQARTVAQRLSKGVTDYWASWAEKIDSQCHECGEESGLGDFGTVIESLVPITVAMSKITEKILQLPIQLSAECEEPKSSGAADGKTDKIKGAHRTGKSPSRDKVGGAPAEKSASLEFPYTLQTHQLSAAQKVQALGKLGFGAILGGRSFVGKTVVVCSLIQQWLAASATAVPVVVVVVAPQCLYRWVVQLREVGLAKRSTLWDRGEDYLPASSAVLVVPSDQLSAFMRGRVHADLAGEKSSATEGSNAEDDTPPDSPRAVVGFVADLRCTPATEIATVLTQLGKAASQMAPLLAARCLLTEDAAPQDTPLSTLWLLSPGTALLDWQAAYPTSGVDLHADHIKRNTLSQLIGNLSVVMKMPASADSMVAAQVSTDFAFLLHLSIIR